MQGGGPDEIRTELKQKWFPTLKAGWYLWIPVQAINMSIVPVQHRLLFVCVLLAARCGQTHSAGTRSTSFGTRSFVRAIICIRPTDTHSNYGRVQAEGDHGYQVNETVIGACILLRRSAGLWLIVA